MNLLITGGAGFIGSRFAEMLTTQEILNPFNQIVVIDKLTYSGNRANLVGIEKNPNFAFEMLDICDEAGVRQALTKYQITHVVNLLRSRMWIDQLSHPRRFIKQM